MVDDFFNSLQELSASPDEASSNKKLKTPNQLSCLMTLVKHYRQLNRFTESTDNSIDLSKSIACQNL